MGGHGHNEDQKRILAAELHVARRHLTDAQKVKLGRDIERPIAREAERIRLANLRQNADSPSVTPVILGRTTDEVASKVGLGSGRSYERGKQVLDELAEEPDAPQLISHIESGDWDLNDARKELHTRHQERRKEGASAGTRPSTSVTPVTEVPVSRNCA